MATIDDLPAELLVLCASFLRPRDLKSAACVSKKFNQCFEPLLYREIYLNFGHPRTNASDLSSFWRRPRFRGCTNTMDGHKLIALMSKQARISPRVRRLIIDCDPCWPCMPYEYRTGRHSGGILPGISTDYLNGCEKLSTEVLQNMSQLRDLNVFKNWPRFLGKFAPSPTLEKLTLDDKNRDSPIPVIKLSFHTFMHYLKHPNLHHLVLHGRDNPTPLKPLGPEANQCGFDDCLSRFSIKTLTLSQNLVGGSLLDSLLRQFPKLKTLNIAAGKSIVWGSLTEPWTLSNSRGLYEAMLRCAGYLEELTIMPPDKLPSRETFVLGSLRSFTSLKSLVIDPKTLVGRQVGRKIESVYDEFSKELGWRCSFAAMLPQNLEHLGLLFDPMPTSNLHLNLEDILQGILVERNERLGLLTRITLYPRDEECGGGVLRGAVWACRDAGIEIRVIKTIKSYQTYFQGQWIQPEWPNWEK